MPTASELQTTLTAYQTARDAILSGNVSTVQVEGQSYSFLSLGEIEKQITVYQNRLALAQPSTSAARGLGIRGRLGGMGY